MNYLLFNNEILISDGNNVRRIDDVNDIKNILGSLEQINLCVVDVDVLIAASVESPIEMKDNILVRKFKEFYKHEAYIIQDERIDKNLFQVIGIKEQKVREIYSSIPSDKVESFVPYGIALRNTLINQGIDLNRTIVFVDDLESEVLLTVFDGLMFSRTRVITNNNEDMLPEIKRSQIDFFKKTEGFLNKKSADFVIVSNKQSFVIELLKNKDNPHVEYLKVIYPALEGLKEINTSIKYRLPEEIIKKRRAINFKRNMATSMLSLFLVAVGAFFLLFNKIEWDIINNNCGLEKLEQRGLVKQLTELDKETYREDLRAHKILNYGISYLTVLGIIPASYIVNSFKFYKSDKWYLDVNLLADDDELFERIPQIGVLKNAEIKDIFVNNQPGKHLKIIL